MCKRRFPRTVSYLPVLSRTELSILSLSSNRVAPMTCGTLTLSLRRNLSPTPLDSRQTAYSSLPALRRPQRLFWGSPMHPPWILSCEASCFYFSIMTLLLAFWFSCQLSSHLERGEFCTSFPLWQLCSLNFNDTVCWKLFFFGSVFIVVAVVWKSTPNSPLNELANISVLVLPAYQSGAISFGGWRRKEKQLLP